MGVAGRDTPALRVSPISAIEYHALAAFFVGKLVASSGWLDQRRLAAHHRVHNSAAELPSGVMHHCLIRLASSLVAP